MGRPGFWAALATTSALCAALAFVAFPKAFPLVRLDVSMSRESALTQARRLAGSQGWGPEGYRQAASFSVDGELQTFVELEGGGKEAFAELLAGGPVAPYQWLVRHFAEGDAEETLVHFTPQGEPYGFRHRFPEDAHGASLSPAAARAIAEAAAVAPPWEVDLARFELVESARETRPNRIDHTFLYERTGHRLGEGRSRLRLSVGGDRFAELARFVEIPEAFQRRYEEMRSANTAITAGGSLAMIVLYLFGGCVVGLFLLLRKRFVIWREAAAWGLVVAATQMAAAVNDWPLTWMRYDTALSVQGFVLQQASLMLLKLVGMAVLLCSSFMAAESLSRRAFPDHPLLWRLWNADAARSRPVLGLTVGGYLLVPVFLAYDVALYLFGHNWLGWWTPSHSLFEPDVLATPLPWLGAIAISLQAGFWEECLFRAVPIAGAALLGDRFGGRRLWIGGALLLQAVVFGAGHAAYATQPPWARVVELILPSIGFGMLYLRFGLLPGVVLHFAFDVVWLSLPLFASTAPGIWVDRALLLLLALVPLWVVASARWRRGSSAELDESFLNRSWRPRERVAPETAAPTRARAPLTPVATRALVAGGALGAVAWVWAVATAPAAPQLHVGRSAVAASARQALDERGVELDGSWTELATVVSGVAQPHRYVWREGGSELFHELLGEYLPEPRWMVRFARFEGDVTNRAEEYRVWIDGDGAVRRVRHDLPEVREGASLDEAAARERAGAEVRRAYGLDVNLLKEVSAEPADRPHRTDWTLTWAVPDRLPLEGGEARIAVEIAGDRVSDRYRFVHVPEEWARAERSRQTGSTILRVLSQVVAAGLFVAGAVGAIVRWSRGRFQPRPFLVALALLLGVGLAGMANAWPTIAAGFSTAEPFPLQTGMVVAFGAVAQTAVAGGLALGLGLVTGWIAGTRESSRPQRLLPGLGLGAVVAGVAATVGRVFPEEAPLGGDYSAAAAVWPWAAVALDGLQGYAFTCVFALLLLGGLDRLTGGWLHRRGLGATLLFGICLAIAGGAAETLARWLAAGLIAGAGTLAAYVFVLRHRFELLPAALAVVAVLELLASALAQRHPGSEVGWALGALLIAGVAALVARQLAPPHPSTGD